MCNTLYTTLMAFPLFILWDWRRVEIIKRSKQMICKDRRRLDPRLKTWPSFCASQRDESTNLIFFTSLGTSFIHQYVCCRKNPWFSTQTTLDRGLRDLSWDHGKGFNEKKIPPNTFPFPRSDFTKFPTQFCLYKLNKSPCFKIPIFCSGFLR
jgi:hypothetical protein